MDDDDEHKCECPPGLPAWMATFADLMSLLMCFFVLLLSFSEMDAMKFKRLAGSMAQAFGVQNKLKVDDIPKGTSIIAQEFSPGEPKPTPINEIWQKTEDITKSSLDVQCSEEYDVEQGEESQEAGAKARVKEKIEEMMQETEDDGLKLAAALQEQIAEGEVDVEVSGRKIIIRIREKGSFKSGSATLDPNYMDVMDEIQGVLAEKPGKILVQGHSDNVPIKTARFPSNWALSSARAVSVAHALLKDDEINPRRFQVTGLADTKALVANDSSANRARNRRVEIVVNQGISSELTEEDKAILQTDGQDILREFNLDEDYLFNLNPDEVF